MGSRESPHLPEGPEGSGPPARCPGHSCGCTACPHQGRAPPRTGHGVRWFWGQSIPRAQVLLPLEKSKSSSRLLRAFPPGILTSNCAIPCPQPQDLPPAASVPFLSYEITLGHLHTPGIRSHAPLLPAPHPRVPVTFPGLALGTGNGSSGMSQVLPGPGGRHGGVGVSLGVPGVPHGLSPLGTRGQAGTGGGRREPSPRAVTAFIKI